MKKILLVEDEAHVVSFIKKGLTEEGYEVTAAMEGKTGLQLAIENNFDLIILDIMLPGINGLEVCESIRRVNTKVPILFLTALGIAENVVLGLEKGADDYLVKPFKFIELVARIKSLLRRGDTAIFEGDFSNAKHIYVLDNLQVNDQRKTVTLNGEIISLTTTEYKLLLYFLQNKDKVLSRKQILEAVWGVDYDLGTNVVDVYINYLRKKVDIDPDKKLIHTVIGMGYILKSE